MTGFPINPPNTAIADQRGFITPSWYRYLAQIQASVGSASAASWQDGYLLAPTPAPVTPFDALEGGGATMPVNVRTVAGDTVVQPNDGHIRADANASPLSVILPLSTQFPGRVVTVKKIDASANAVTVVPSGGEVIDGAASVSTTTSMAAYRLLSNGLSGWDLI